MKKFFSFILAALCLSASALAQDSYYYYNGSRMPLNTDTTKMVSITPISGNVQLSSSDGFTLVNTITGKRSVMRVYEQDPSTKNKAAVPVSSPSVSIQPCYQTTGGKELAPNGYINVKLKSPEDYPLLQSVAKNKNCEIIEQNTFMPLWYNLMVTPGPGRNSVDIANEIYETGQFEASFPSFSFDALEISYDPDVYRQWGLYNSQYKGLDISISKAWNYSTGRGIKIAIVDHGIDMSHKDLQDNIHPRSYDTETKSSPSRVYGEHGTHCAGIAAAVRNNGINIAGVAPDAQLMSVSNRLAGDNSETTLADGINWAWQNGADIISCSWWCEDNDLIRDAIKNAVSKGREGRGCVFVKSAGNTGSAISFPGDYGPEVIAVANMTKNGILAGTSAYGPNMFVAAPGTDIVSTIPGNRVASKSGTSMACPHVSGLAALILERNPSLTAVQVREIIAKNAKKIGTRPYSTNKIYGTWNQYYGYGLIDAYEAVINTPRN